MHCIVLYCRILYSVVQTLRVCMQAILFSSLLLLFHPSRLYSCYCYYYSPIPPTWAEQQHAAQRSRQNTQLSVVCIRRDKLIHLLSNRATPIDLVAKSIVKPIHTERGKVEVLCRTDSPSPRPSHTPPIPSLTSTRSFTIPATS